MKIKRRFWSIYGRWAWDRNRSDFSGVLADSIVKLINQYSNSKDESILDAGCGTGNFSLALAADGFNVLGCDYAPGMLKQANKKITKDSSLSKRLRFKTMDLTTPLPFAENSFHHIICISVLQALHDPGKTLREFQRVLKSGGKLLAVHFPHSPLQALTLKEEVSHRLQLAGKTTPFTRLLWTAKCYMERKGHSSDWSTDQFTAMISESGFRIVELQQDSPLLVIAEK